MVHPAVHRAAVSCFIIAWLRVCQLVCAYPVMRLLLRKVPSILQKVEMASLCFQYSDAIVRAMICAR